MFICYHMYEYIHLYMSVCGDLTTTLGVVSQGLPTLFLFVCLFITSSLIILALTNLAKLTGPLTPEIFLSPPPWHQNCQHLFTWVLKIKLGFLCLHDDTATNLAISQPCNIIFIMAVIIDLEYSFENNVKDFQTRLTTQSAVGTLEIHIPVCACAK